MRRGDAARYCGLLSLARSTTRTLRVPSSSLLAKVMATELPSGSQLVEATVEPLSKFSSPTLTTFLAFEADGHHRVPVVAFVGLPLDGELVVSLTACSSEIGGSPPNVVCSH